MSKLRLGKMSSKEIAEWLGVSYNTYRGKIDYYLQRVEDYCEFERYHGGIDITIIYIDEYNKELIKEEDELFKRFNDYFRNNT